MFTKFSMGKYGTCGRHHRCSSVFVQDCHPGGLQLRFSSRGVEESRSFRSMRVKQCVYNWSFRMFQITNVLTCFKFPSKRATRSIPGPSWTANVAWSWSPKGPHWLNMPMSKALQTYVATRAPKEFLFISMKTMKTRTASKRETRK